MSIILERVKPIAAEVRLWAEEYAERCGGYNADNLCGYCAIASAELYRKLKRAGIASEIHMWDNYGECHVFLVVDDYVVDITATQFSEFADEPVLILHYREAQAYEYYVTSHIVGSDRELVKLQKRQGWTVSQIAKLAA